MYQEEAMYSQQPQLNAVNYVTTPKYHVGMTWTVKATNVPTILVMICAIVATILCIIATIIPVWLSGPVVEYGLWEVCPASEQFTATGVPINCTSWMETDPCNSEINLVRTLAILSCCAFFLSFVYSACLAGFGIPAGSRAVGCGVLVLALTAMSLCLSTWIIYTLDFAQNVECNSVANAVTGNIDSLLVLNHLGGAWILFVVASGLSVLQVFAALWMMLVYPRVPRAPPSAADPRFHSWMHRRTDRYNLDPIGERAGERDADIALAQYAHPTPVDFEGGYADNYY